MAQEIHAAHALSRLMDLRREARSRHGRQPDPVPEGRDEGELAAWSAADGQLLQALSKQGWIDRVPEVFQVSSLDRSYSMGRAGGRGWIAISSNALGETGWPCVQDRDEAAILWRAHMLIHEAAHLRMHQWDVHFKPTSDRLGNGMAKILDRWQLGPLSLGVLMPARSVMHECFADAFAVAAMLEMTDHSPAVLELAEQLVKQRTQDSRRSEIAFAKPGARRASPMLVPFGGTHHTQHAVAHLLQTRQTWQGQSPATLLPMLQQVASDAMLDWLRPDRILPSGQRQGWAAMESLVFRTNLDMTQAAIERLGCQSMGNMDDWARREHPLKTVVDAAWPAIMRELEQHPPKARRAVQPFFAGPQGRTTDGLATVAQVRSACQSAERGRELALEFRTTRNQLDCEMGQLRKALLEKPADTGLADKSRHPIANRATKPRIAP